MERPCPCGSKLASWWLNDARGIPCCRVCERCEKQKMSRYRADIFTDPNYQTDEPIDSD